MAIANKHFYDKYPAARVEDDDFPGQPWVDFAILAKLFDKFPADQPIQAELVDRLYVRCSDVPGANVMRYDGDWFAVGTKQAKAICEDRGWAGELFRNA